MDPFERVRLYLAEKGNSVNLEIGFDIPLIAKKSKGAYLYDNHNKKYLDYFCGNGSVLLGHANEKIISAVSNELKKGFNFSYTSELEVELARKLCHLLTNIDKFRIYNSNLSAFMYATYLSRYYTNREYILQFKGHSYCGSYIFTYEETNINPIIDNKHNKTVTIELHDLDALIEVIDEKGLNIAAIIVEPIAVNMGCMAIEADFLQKIRDFCDEFDILLIFDEQYSGFRVCLKGMQDWYGINADLVCVGDSLADGMPIGILGGKSKIMDQLCFVEKKNKMQNELPNVVSLIVSTELLSIINNETYQDLENKTKKLIIGIRNLASKYGINVYCNQFGGIFSILFNDVDYINSYQDVKKTDKVLFKQFFLNLLNISSIYWNPYYLGSGFITCAHTIEQIDDTLSAIELFFSKVTKN